MREIVARRPALRAREVVDARGGPAALRSGQPYKLELIDELPEGEEISIYTQGDFTDLCRGPHVASTGELDPTRSS